MKIMRNLFNDKAEKCFTAMALTAGFVALCLSGKEAAALVLAFGAYAVRILLGLDDTGIAKAVMGAIRRTAVRFLPVLASGIVLAVLVLSGLELAAVIWGLGCYVVCVASGLRKAGKQLRIIHLHHKRAA